MSSENSSRNVNVVAVFSYNSGRFCNFCLLKRQDVSTKQETGIFPIFKKSLELIFP